MVFGMETLKQLILMRPSHRLEFLDVLLDFTSNEITEVGLFAFFVSEDVSSLNL